MDMATACLSSLSLPLPRWQLGRPPPSSTTTCCCVPAAANSISCKTTNGGPPLEPIVVIGDPPTYVSAPSRRIVAVGDLHGDLRQARRALEIAGVVSSCGMDLWTGGDTVLVQLGDVLDRGEDEIAILSLLRSLDFQARAQGGAVFQINGNHETMNVEGDFRYVDSGAFDECANFLTFLEGCKYDWETAFVGWIGASREYKRYEKLSQSAWGPWDLLVKKRNGVTARSTLLRQGGPLACELARHGVILKVNDWVFCHGGILPRHVEYGVERMNREVSRWMRGVGENEGGCDIPFLATRGHNSVVWSRLYSRDVSDLEDSKIDKIQSVLRKTLKSLGAKGLVVGHTPQHSGANCEFNCRVWRIDVGMSSGVTNSRPEVLEILGDKARVVRSKRDSHSELQVVDYT